ncbi:CocE/NonD family hydrolase [Aquihabitans sp. McL0605]|uniref:S15 peptidase family protein n=1 Tax=Aquihabitans sp. McL0605 TaxID=3415671 RepID=UPI003CE80A9E
MRRLAPQILIASALLLASCSSSGSDSSKATTTTTAAPGKAAATGGHACDQGATAKVTTAPVPGVASDQTMTSFDGTEIRLHWFPVDGADKADPAPTILMGPGWSLAGDTSTDGAALFGALSINGMHKAGYNVLTWDPRGFGASTGVATVNDPTKEGRDVQGLLDFVAEQPEAKTDATGDPRVGMVGFSYGGGIQLTTAAIDCRIDAIVPGIAWHSLQTSLYKADTVKTGWSKILTSTVPEDRLDPHIVSATKSGLGDGTLSDEDREWFISRGPGDAVKDIDIPTLFVQGTVDTLFTLDEATTNYGILRKDDVPTAMLWFCGGHGTCLTKAGDPDRVGKASFEWLDKYLKGDATKIDADTNRLNLIDQDGVQWKAKDWPVAQGEPVTATGSGTLQLQADGGSGAGSITPPAGDPLGGLVANITPTKAENAVNVAIDPSTTDALALGAPKLTFTYSGELTDPPAAPITRVFAQLVDDQTGLILGNQITPIKVTLDGKSHTVDTPLEMIAHHLTPGHTLTLQIVATTSAYATPALGGQITFPKIEISLPTAEAKAVTKG